MICLDEHRATGFTSVRVPSSDDLFFNRLPPECLQKVFGAAAPMTPHSAILNSSAVDDNILCANIFRLPQDRVLG